MTIKPGWVRTLAEHKNMTPDRARLLQRVADQAVEEYSIDGDANDWKDELSALQMFARRTRDREREALDRIGELKDSPQIHDVMINVADDQWRQAQVYGEQAKAAEDAIALIKGAGQTTLATIANKLPRRSDLPPLSHEWQQQQTPQQPIFHTDPWAFNPHSVLQPPMFQWPPPMPMFQPFVSPMPPFMHHFMMPMGMPPMMPPPIWPMMPFGFGMF